MSIYSLVFKAEVKERILENVALSEYCWVPLEMLGAEVVEVVEEEVAEEDTNVKNMRTEAMMVEVAILTPEAEEAEAEEAELEEAQEEEAQVEAVVVLMMVRRCAPMCLVIWAPDEQCNTPLSN
uniref:Uncharacterized protein n=1 Tax=Ascaris lumbricoides TaxID=6252 RepID=A0A0M3IHB0_ASCLU